MSSSVTVRVRSLLISGVAVLAVLAVYLLGAGGGGDALAATAPPATAGDPSTGALRTLTMTGRGEVTAVPDQLTFRLAVTSTRDDVRTALDASSGTLDRVLAALEREGVARKDTRSTGLSIDPVYRYLTGAPPQITGYRVRQSLSVLVRDLRRGGRAIAATVGAGGNAVRVSGIGLEIGDREQLLADARDAAVAAATTKARQYAEATGQSLGEVLTLREGSRPSAPRAFFQTSSLSRAGVLAAADRAVPIRAGRAELGITVAIVWSLSEGD
jgi:uncharacterized protein YggE